ncbi:K(+)-transporting ATPase subunit F [Corynebacterium epidermidicanis]|nr:K(+)-transporting ATPase subunit F [Corynebacterium epidermidicanis]
MNIALLLIVLGLLGYLVVSLIDPERFA